MQFLILCIFVFLCNQAALGDEPKRLQLKLYKHQSCTKGSPNEKIRFPSNTDAPLEPDPDRGDGCYTIKGTVQVLQPISGTVQLYVESKYGLKAPAEECRGAHENGCGGVGSCVYCDACEGIKELGKNAVQLVVAKKPFDCKKGLTRRNYTDIRISFCMPTKQEFLKNQNMDEEFWNRYGAAGQTVFLTLYIFNRQVNTLPRAELQKIANPNSDQVIGCHKLVGSVSDPSSSPS